MGESFITGIALGAGLTFVVVLLVFLWIIIRNLRPLGWALLLAAVVLLLTHL